MLELEKLKYTILDKDKALLSPESADLYNNVYRYWKKTWRDILIKAGSPQTWSADDFFRQTFIPVVTYGDEIVAANCSTIFDLRSECLKDMKYFSIFNQNVYTWLENHRVQKLMTMEFLSVQEKWREQHVGFSFAEVLIGLGSKIIEEHGLCAAIGISVKAAKITEKSSRLAYELVTDDVERGMIPCDVVCLDAKKSAPHQDAQTNKIINFLWENKNDFKNKTADKMAA